MPTSVDIKNLKINKLTEAQYDTAVQGGVIGENELSVITDMVDKAVQVSTMPTASADELGNIYQYVGATDANYTNGYFYKCEGAGDPVVYSWAQVNVQPAPSGLPDQTGQSGKFLTTDGTDASWSDRVVISSDSSIELRTPGGKKCSIFQRQNNILDATIMFYKNDGSTSFGSINFADKLIYLSGTDTYGYITRFIEITPSALFHHSDTYTGIATLGTTSHRWTNVYTAKINNGADINVPTTGGTLALTSDLPSTPATMPELTVADWSNNTQTVTVTGVTATNTVFVSPAPASASDYASAGIICTAQGTDSLTFTCTTVPTNAITVNVVIMG